MQAPITVSDIFDLKPSNSLKNSYSEDNARKKEELERQKALQAAEVTKKATELFLKWRMAHEAAREQAAKPLPVEVLKYNNNTKSLFDLSKF